MTTLDRSAPSRSPRPARPPHRSHVIADSVTMLQRNLLHMVRYPGLSLFTILGPVVLLLLFVFVLGGTLGAGLPGAGSGDAVDGAGGRDAYLAYVMPGILIVTIAGTAGGTATTVSMDLADGITARFRTMAISRAAVLAGHVLGNTLQGVLAALLVLGVGLLIGFRPGASPLGWLAVIGLVTLVAFSVSWLGVAMGMQARSVETASNLPLVLTFLPLLGSGFVPTASLPEGLRVVAELQPFTPFTEGLRALLGGTEPGMTLPLSLGWCVVLAVAGYIWSRALYERRSVR
ncbi:ABC transporter permease [Subtercola boreus]|uniref:Transport permease protein n=1 Tax=Subtercola boreus TaxID=120213 RepID=A0A3E0VIE5_9MICO|nr:ABC transporter permease [Subtercola boreus]RFA08637.1 ABC transporter permease [Subtercola boreus]TQL54422.1 ABC-2 type transport system permease protein [Subtercola boreus]